MEVMATAIPTVVGAARLRFTTRADGDFHADLVAPDELRRRQRAVVDLPWTFLDEVHGVEVVTVREPGQHTGARADAAVTDRAGAVLGIWVGDCAPVALVAPSRCDRRRPCRVAGGRGPVCCPPPSRPCAGSVRRTWWPTSGRASGPSATSSAPPTSTTSGSASGPRWWPPRRAGAPALDMVALVAASLAEVDVEVGVVRPVHRVRRPVLVASGPRRSRAPGHGRVAGGRVVMVGRHQPGGGPAGRAPPAASPPRAATASPSSPSPRASAPRWSRRPSPWGSTTSARTTPRSCWPSWPAWARTGPGCTSSAGCSRTRCRSLAGVVDLWQSIDRASLVEPLAKLRPPGQRCWCR